MSDLKKSLQHHAFIATTDRKSLYTQLKNLVQQAQDVANQELEQRRNTLKLLLEHEDKIYEEEFSSKVKSRIEEDIRERKGNLLKIKEESTKTELEFLKSKRIQQYMNSCYEIREALRNKETQNIKECQLEQIVEKERTFKKEQDLDKYWLKVQHINLKLMDEHQRQEDCLKKHLTKHVADTRKAQLEQLQEKREKDGREKLEETKKINALVEELRVEAFDQTILSKSKKSSEYRTELLKMMKEKEEMTAKEKQEQADVHRKLMNDVKREKVEHVLATKEKKKAFHKATLDFIKFVKGVRELEEQQEQMFGNRIEELSRIDRCTKRNILLERQRKARIAEQCYADLRKQICEQHKARLREEAEYRECKMLENRFVHREISREEIIENKQKIRNELDKQIEELQMKREAENEKFSHDLERTSNDPELCAELAEKYIRDGIDYLEPHPNRNILDCSSHEYVAKQSAGQGATPKTCIEPCGKTGKVPGDGRGDEERF